MEVARAPRREEATKRAANLSGLCVCVFLYPSLLIAEWSIGAWCPVTAERWADGRDDCEGKGKGTMGWTGSRRFSWLAGGR
jgi:hypothetical protein